MSVYDSPHIVPPLQSGVGKLPELGMPQSPGVLATLKAGGELSPIWGTVEAANVAISRWRGGYDPSFDPAAEPLDPDLEPFRTRMAMAANRGEYEALRSTARRQVDAQRTLEEAGALGDVVSMAGAMASMALAPLSPWLTLAVSGAESIGQEVVRPDVPLWQNVLAMSGDVVAAGMARRIGIKKLPNDVRAPLVEQVQGVGADVAGSRAPLTEAEALQALEPKPVPLLEPLGRALSPAVRAAHASFLATKEAVGGLTPWQFFLKGNAKGYHLGDASAEFELNAKWRARALDATRAIYESFAQYRGFPASQPVRGAIKARVGDMVGHLAGGSEGRPTGGLKSIHEFMDDVSWALHNGDHHPTNMPAAQAAKKIRPLLDELSAEADRLGIYDPPEIRVSRFMETRASKLEEELRQLERLEARGKASEHVATMKAEVKKLLKESRIILQKAQERIAKEGLKPGMKRITANPSYFRYVYNKPVVRERRAEFEALLVEKGGFKPADAAKTVDKILHRPDIKGYTDPLDVPHSSPGYEREIDLPYDDLKPFLNNNAQDVLRFHARTLGADIALANRFGDWGLPGQIDDIRAEARQAIASGRMTPDVANAKALEEIKLVEYMRDRIRGVVGIAKDPESLSWRTIEMIRHWNVFTKMGMSGIGSLPDMVRPLYVKGLDRAMRSAIKPLLSAPAAMKMAKVEMRRLGIAMETASNVFAVAMANADETVFPLTAFERAVNKGAHKFWLLTGLPVVSDMAHTIGFLTASDWLLQAAEKHAKGRLKPKNIESLARARIDEAMLERIHTEWKKQSTVHGAGPEGEFRIASLAEWDPAVARAYGNAIWEEVDRMVPKGTAGDRPFWMDTKVGSLIGQFKGYSVQSYTRVMMGGFQDPYRARMVYGAMLLVGAGMLATTLNQAAKGHRQDEPFLDQLAAAVDKSGVLSAFGDLNNLVEGLSGYTQGIGPWMGVNAPFKQDGWFSAGSVLGPSVDIAHQLTTLFKAGLTDEVGAKEGIRAARKLLFMQNWWGTYMAMNDMESDVGALMGAER